MRSAISASTPRRSSGTSPGTSAPPTARAIWPGTFAAPLILATYSRLVIDPNRQTEDPTSIPEISDETTIPANAAISAEARASRIAALHVPYHAVVDDVVSRLRRDGRVPMVVSVHTCTPVFKGFERPWQIGVLWNRDPRIAAPLIKALAARGDLCVGDNQPYSGRDAQGYTVKHHAERARPAGGGAGDPAGPRRHPSRRRRTGPASSPRRCGRSCRDPALRKVEQF